LRCGFEEAIALAEAEDYAETLDYGYLGPAQAYHLADEIGHGAEAYSLVRNSHLAAEEYVTGFFDTGLEHQGMWTSPLPYSSRVQQPTAPSQPTSDRKEPRDLARDRIRPGCR
jgi:hypothetical protein